MRRHISASASRSPAAMRGPRSASLRPTFIALHSTQKGAGTQNEARGLQLPRHAVEDVSDDADAAVREARVCSDVGSADRLAWCSVFGLQRGAPAAMLD